MLTNWTKPLYNPIVNSTGRDPSAAWRVGQSGEWRIRDQEGMEYSARSDAAVAAGQWYTVGRINSTAAVPNPAFTPGECPSVYPLPGPTPGFEAEYAAIASAGGGLPTTVMKVSNDLARRGPGREPSRAVPRGLL